MIEVVPLDFTTGANVLVSNKGLAACLYFKTFARHVAAGRRRDVGPRPDAVPLRLRRQGLQGRHQARALRRQGDRRHRPAHRARRPAPARRWSTRCRPAATATRPGLVRLAGKASASAVKAAAAQAGPDPVDIPAGLPGTVMAFKGADAPPHVILHGPSGQVFDTGTGNAPVEANGLRGAQERPARHHRDRHREARGGPLDGRDRRGLLAAGAGHPGRRHAPGHRDRQGHRLRPRPPPDYTVKGLPAGGRVEFVEAGNGGGGRIGIVKADGRGTLKFHPGRWRARQA